MSSGFDRAVQNLMQIIKESDKNKTFALDTQAEVLRIEDGTAWVHLPGGVDETPVKLTMNAQAGDIVQVRIAGGRAWLTGNATSPPTDDKVANQAQQGVIDVKNIVAENIQATNAKFQYVEADTAKIHNLEADEIHAGITYTNELIAEDVTTENLAAASGYIQELVAEDITAQNITADHAAVRNLDANYAKINAANITDLAAQNAWVNKIMIQTGLIAHESDIFTLDAIQVNAANITAGTIDVNRLIVTVNGQKYLVNVDPSTGTPSYEKLDGNIVKPRTIAADKIVAHDITVQEITTENLVGTNGWINLSQGRFFYGDGASYASATNAIEWNGTTLRIKGDIGDSVVFNNYSTTTEMNSAIGTAVDGIEVGGRNLFKNTEVSLSTLNGNATGGISTKIIPEGSQITVSVMIDADNITWDTTPSYHRIGCEMAVPKSSGYQYVGVWAGKEILDSANIVAEFTGSFHGRVSKTFTLLGDISIDKACALYIQGVNSGSVTVSNIKVEIGNKATDWTLAPEDVQAEIDAKKSVHTLNSAYLSTGTTYANVLGWCEDGNAHGFDIDIVSTPLSNVKIGDTVRVKYFVNNMGSNGTIVYVVGTALEIYGTTNPNIMTVRLGNINLETTVIDGGHILTGTLDATKVNVINLNADNISAGTISVSRLPSDALKTIRTVERNSGATYAQIKGWASLDPCGWSTIVDLSGVRVGDTCRVAIPVSDMSGVTAYITGTVEVVSSTYLEMSGQSISSTTIDGGMILTGKVAASRIDTDNITIGQSQVTNLTTDLNSIREFADALTSAKQISTYTRSFTKANWDTYGASGHSESWSSGGYDNTHISVGDKAYITGHVSDKTGWHAAILGTVTSVSTTAVVMTSIKVLYNSAQTEKYITKIDESGILISPSGNKPSASAPQNSIKIDGNGLNVYKGGVSVASYGDYARIGKENLQRVETKSDGVYIYNGSNVQEGYFGTFARIGNYNSNNVRMDSNGVNINTSQDNSVAFFGSTSRIGKSGQTHLEVTSAALNVYSNSGSKIVATLGEYTNGSGRLDIAGVSANSGAYVYPAIIGLKGSADTDLVEMVSDRLRWGSPNTNHKYIELFRSSDFSTLFVEGSASDVNLQVSGHVYATNYLESSNRVEAGTRFKSEYCYTETISTDNRVAITSGGNMGKYKSSSRRYKDQIEDSTFDPHGLYGLRARQFRYRDGYFALDDDNPHAYDLQVGFIAEEVEQYYPAAAVYDTDTGEIENWEERKMIPPMLTLIQELNDRLTKLEQKGVA